MAPTVDTSAVWFIGDADRPADVTWEPWSDFEAALRERDYLIIFNGRCTPGVEWWAGVRFVRTGDVHWYHGEARPDAPGREE